MQASVQVKSKTQKIQKKQSSKRAIIVLASILVILGFLAGTGSGVLQYALAAVGCMGAPVAASRFMAGYSYELPGDQGYGPGVFNEYYCSEQEARSAGFHPSPGTDAAEKQDQEFERIREEEKRFSPEKLDYKVYVTTGVHEHRELEISSMGSSGVNKQVFFAVRKGGYVVANIREGKIPNDYEVCTGSEDSCEVIGATVMGSPIKKQIANKDIVTYGAAIDDTFINVSTDLSEQDVLDIFNSLTEYKDES